MKGTLHKTEQGWEISHATYDITLNRWTAGKFPIHPDYVKYYFLDEDAEGGDVEFEIVEEIPASCHNNPFCSGDETCIKCRIKYAKLIKPKN